MSKVKEQTEVTGDKWLNATKDKIGLADIGEKARVGVYQLVETIELEGVVTAKKVR